MAQRAYDIVVVGGGIVGLATARDLLARRPGVRLAVLEKEPEIGQHQTGHNSGVIHAGVYYAPGSLKAKLCAEGRQKTYEYCEQKGIRYDKCGKLIVAIDESELPRLEELYRRATANGVPGIEMVGPERIRELEPHAAGIKGLWSPETGIVNWLEVARAYADDVREDGGVILTSHEVAAIGRKDGWVLLKTVFDEVIPTRHLVTCAGLQSDRVAAMSGAPKNPQIVPFRGDYYVLKPEKGYLTRGMIYPVPDPEFPFLGVHFTRRIGGDVWLGPNAVLAFGREAYGRLDVNPVDLADTLAYPGFWTLARKYWKMGSSEMIRDFSRSLFIETCKRYVPEVTEDDVLPDAMPSGVRAQALEADGKLVDDFIIQKSERIIHVRNAPSPAATSSMAIGRIIADEAERTFALAS
ncbi:MAG: L-2-hydroxyglutarate oxidase [Chloroflexota bacterium]|nr:L-2-hydroxyglutarate oxidase [Chloroflexota bacterium]